MDVIVIQREDGSLHSTSFFVQFGILDLFKTKDRRVDIEVNGVHIDEIEMRLFDTGAAYFQGNRRQKQQTPEIQINSKPAVPEAAKKIDANGLSETQNNLLKFNLNTLDAYFKASNVLEIALNKTNIKAQERTRITSDPKKYASFKSINSEAGSVTSNTASSGSNSSDVLVDSVDCFEEIEVKKPYTQKQLAPIPVTTRRATALKDRSGLL